MRRVMVRHVPLQRRQDSELVTV